MENSPYLCIVNQKDTPLRDTSKEARLTGRLLASDESL